MAVGHSLGGLALLRAVERLAPARAVYSDPAWHLRRGPDGYVPELFVRGKSLSRDLVKGFNPRWSDEDLDTEMESVRVWDERSAYGLVDVTGTDMWPLRPAVPSLVTLADPSLLISADDAKMLEGRGFALRTVAGAGHTIHRDDFDGFMSALDGWF